MPTQVKVLVTERRGLPSSISQMRQDLDDFRREQREEMRGLNEYISSAFRMMGEALGISIPPCRGRTADVSTPRASPPGPYHTTSVPSTSAAGPHLQHSRRQPTI